jgi:uncharacterized protein (DUF1778 family)
LYVQCLYVEGGVMTAAPRLNFRVRPDTERRLRAAAAACSQSPTDFVISAAEQRADEILATHTLVPADYFDRLLAALDEPAEANEALRTAASRPRQFTQH